LTHQLRCLVVVLVLGEWELSGLPGVSSPCTPFRRFQVTDKIAESWSIEHEHEDEDETKVRGQ
jgi:hypothetical protein